MNNIEQLSKTCATLYKAIFTHEPGTPARRRAIAIFQKASCERAALKRSLKKNS